MGRHEKAGAEWAGISHTPEALSASAFSLTPSGVAPLVRVALRRVAHTLYKDVAAALLRPVNRGTLRVQNHAGPLGIRATHGIIAGFRPALYEHSVVSHGETPVDLPLVH